MSGLVAAFATRDELNRALRRLRTASVGRLETYTPTALEEDEKGRGSPIPLLIFLAGLAGAAAMYALETYSDVLNWPVNIGGRPPFSWPAFVPIAFEVGVLCAVSTGFFGYLIVARLSRLWEPVDECAAARQAMRDQWVIAVYTDDHRHLDHARQLLDSCQPLSIEYIGSELQEVPA
jgi:hypothetical protein